MPALLGFVPPPSLAPAFTPPPATGSLQMTPGPSTAAKPITGGKYPSLKPSPSSLPPRGLPPSGLPAPAGAAGGFGLGGVGIGVGIAIAYELLFPPPAGDNYYDRNPKNPPPLYKLHPPEPSKDVQTPGTPFKGGQSKVLYHVKGTQTVIYDDRPGGAKLSVKHTYNTALYGKAGSRDGPLYGPILGIDPSYKMVGGSSFGAPLAVQHVDDNVYPGFVRVTYLKVVTSDPDIGYYNYGTNRIVESQITSITRFDGQPDLGGDPAPTSPQIKSAPGNSLGAPSAAPPSAAPSAAPVPPGISGFPSGSPSGFPNGSPNGSPSGSPGGFPSPSPAPSPGPAPQPNKLLGPAPSPSPNPSPNGLPGPSPGPGVSGPAPSPAPSKAPSPAPSVYRSPAPADPTKYPDTGFQPNIFTPNPLTPNPLTPNPLAPQKFQPNPKTGNPEPKTPPLTLPAKSPAPETTPIDDLRKQIDKYLGPAAILLAGITALVQPDKLKEAANAGTCQALAPSGCGAKLSNDAATAAANSTKNNVALSGIWAFLEALQTAFLIPIKAGVELVNTKLGPLMKGVDGIGGFLGRVSKSMGVDRALNLIAIASNLHNAMMLSANLKVTLLEMLSSVGNATGLLQTPDNENVDLNQVFNAGVEAAVIKIVGVDNYAGLKINLRKYNAIYQAATNSLNAVSGMFNAMGNVLEQAAENTGRIGNALKGAGVVSEKAYQWLAEKFDAKSSKFIKFQSTIGDVTQVLETINEIAETVVEGQQAATEFQTANKAFVEAVAAAKKVDGIENKAVQEEATKAKENATKDPTGEIETGLLSFLTN